MDATLAGVEGMAADGQGNLYLADSLDHRIRRVDMVTGTISTVAGTGRQSFGGDGGPASEAGLNSPYDVAVDAQGNIYVADYGNRRVRRISPGGSMETVAGGGSADGTPAVAARFEGPRNIALDEEGNLYIADFDGHRVYRVSPSGKIVPVAGTGTAGKDADGPALASRLDSPAGLAFCPQDGLYIADSGNNRVLLLADGYLHTALGGAGTTVPVNRPLGLAVDGNRTLYVADSGGGRVVRRLATGQSFVIADELPAVLDVVVARGVLVGSGDAVWLVESAATTRVAGRGRDNPVRDVGKAEEVSLDGPIGVATDRFGRLLIAEEGRRRVRRVDAGDWISTIAGNGEAGLGGDGGLATNAQLKDPVAVALDPQGRIWVADYLGNTVRRIELDGTIVTVAGNGTAGYGGDGDLAANALLNRPRAVAVDSYGFAYVADSGNRRVRVIRPDGTIDTVAGTGVRGLSGDRGLARLAALDNPTGLAIDEEQCLYIADAGSHTVRKIRIDGIIVRVAGTGVAGFGGDGGSAARALFDSPSGLAFDDSGGLLIADTGNHRVRRIGADGFISTIAGTGAAGFRGDGAAAAMASLDSPSGIAVAPDGSVYVADLGNQRIRRLFQAQTPSRVESAGEIEVVHGATFLTGPIAPGQIISIFGSGIGPQKSAVGALGANGGFSPILGGTEVRINGLPAPLFFAAADQVNAQVPYEVGDADTAVVDVFVAGELHSQGTAPLTRAAPGLFTLENGAGQAIAINEDGTINTVDNAAPRGSIVVLYATGEGLTSPGAIAGRPAAAPLPRPTLPVEVRIAGLPAEVLYAGSAPGFAGLMQINVRVPDGFAPTGTLSVELFVGAASSRSGVWIAVK